MEIKNGSKWFSSNQKVFVVISTATIEGKDWVYYRAEQPVDHLPSEFSCYVESFLSRFTPLPE
jgi:hypothetical protein